MGYAYRGIGAGALVIVAVLALAAPASAKPVFGIVPQDGALPAASDLDLMAPAGVGGLRTMISWAAVERDRGTYDWSQTDGLIRETTIRGITPFVFLYGTPRWAAQVDGRGCNADECIVYPPRTDETREAFGRFAAAAAERYWPEGTFWTATVSLDDYAESPEPCEVDPNRCVP